MTEPNENPLKYQVGGDHYRRLKYQPIQLIHDLNLDFDRANCIKYIVRLGHKGDPMEDIQKVRQYLQFYEEKHKVNSNKVMNFIHQFKNGVLALFIISLLCNNFFQARYYLDKLEDEIREGKSDEVPEM